ncbi:MAG: GIY-YIG nuclease family protein [Chitinophagaceae bacterium]|nr:GIY-YIG nuclease family protein [Rubrivivax sp.]
MTIRYFTSTSTLSPYQILTNESEPEERYGTAYADVDADPYLVTQRHGFLRLSEQGPLLYAVRLSDGLIKIGYTTALARRIDKLCLEHHVRMAEFLGFKFGTLDEEKAVHLSLKGHAAHGREFYHPHPEVLSVVNEWRSALGIERIAA